MALDGLGEKLKSLFKPKEDARFKGQGRRLGTAEAQSTAQRPNPAQSATADGGRTGSRPSAPDTNASSTAPSPLKPPPQPLGPGGRPALVLSRSHRTEDVVLDAAVMANTPTGKEATLVSAHKPPGGGRGGGAAGGPGSPSSPLGSTPGSPPPPYPVSPPPAWYPYSGSAATSPPPPQTSGAAGACNAAGGGGSGGGSGVGGAGMTVGGLPAGGLTVEVPRSSPGGGRGMPGGGGGGGHSAALGLAAGRGRSGQLRSSNSSNVGSMVSTISTPTAAEKRMGGFRCPAPPTDGAMADYGLAPATSQAYELQRCLALVLSTPSRPLPKCQPPTAPTTSSAEPAAAAVPPASGAGEPSLAGAAASDADAAAGSAAAAAAAEGDPRCLDPMASSSLSSSRSPTETLSATDAAAAPEALGAGFRGGGAAAGMSVAAVAGPRECCDALLRLLRNVMTRPEEPKFRLIRLSNPKMQETIVGVPGAVEFLEAAGFQMRFAPDDGSDTANQAHLVLPDEIPPAALAEAFRILSEVMAAHGLASAPNSSSNIVLSGPAPAAAAAAPAGPPPSRLQQAAAAAAPAVERCTQVLLPAAPDVTVPDWFFERTGAEVREHWAAMVRRREEAERFMTRTMREVRRQQEAAAAAAAEAVAAGGGGGGGQANVATVRVRFPEGVCLQGRFGGGEPVTRVFEWVSAALRSPALTFELVKPDRRPLETTATLCATAAKGGAARAGSVTVPLTVRAADMLPSVLLNLRPTGQEACALAAANVPLLSDEMLRTTKAQ